MLVVEERSRDNYEHIKEAFAQEWTVNTPKTSNISHQRIIDSYKVAYVTGKNEKKCKYLHP